jgi:hypothetical protein
MNFLSVLRVKYPVSRTGGLGLNRHTVAQRTLSPLPFEEHEDPVMGIGI